MRDMKRGQSQTPQDCRYRFDSGAHVLIAKAVCSSESSSLSRAPKAKATSVFQGNINNLLNQPSTQSTHQHKVTYLSKASRTNNGAPARNLHPLDNPLISRLLKALHSLQHHPPTPPPHLRRAITLLRLRLPPPSPHHRRLLPSTRPSPREILV